MGFPGVGVALDVAEGSELGCSRNSFTDDIVGTGTGAADHTGDPVYASISNPKCFSAASIPLSRTGY